MPCRFLAQLVMLEENPPFFSASFFWILFQLYFIIPLNDSPRDIKKWSGYKSLKLKSVKMTSHENDPLSTKSPLNSCGFVKEKCIFKPPPRYNLNLSHLSETAVQVSSCPTPPYSFLLTVAHPLDTNFFLSPAFHYFKNQRRHLWFFYQENISICENPLIFIK